MTAPGIFMTYVAMSWMTKKSCGTPLLSVNTVKLKRKFCSTGKQFDYIWKSLPQHCLIHRWPYHSRPSRPYETVFLFKWAGWFPVDHQSYFCSAWSGAFSAGWHSRPVVNLAGPLISKPRVKSRPMIPIGRLSR